MNLEALENGEIDVINWHLPGEYAKNWSQPPYNETIAVEKYPIAGMFQLDINNNETVSAFGSWRSPTSYFEFRHAIAHLINKTKIIEEFLEGLRFTIEHASNALDGMVQPRR